MTIGKDLSLRSRSTLLRHAEGFQDQTRRIRFGAHGVGNHTLMSVRARLFLEDILAEIRTEVAATPEGWRADVTVTELGDATRHSVSLSRLDYDRLTDSRCTPEQCIRISFEFLLEREPKESILQTFDLRVISRYFPDYEREAERRLAGALRAPSRWSSDVVLEDWFGKPAVVGPVVR